MTRRRAAAALALGLIAGVALTGCTPEPTVMKTPHLTWVDGKKPSSDLENHPAVKTLRAATIGDAMAWNAGDFTIRQLTDNYSYLTIVGSIVEQYKDQGTDPWVYRGPLPFEPVSVTERENGSYEVIVCALPVSDWVISRPGRKWSSPPVPYLQHWDIGNFDKIGLRVVGGGGAEGGTCDGSTVPVARFDPQPVLPKGPITEPKRAPLPENE